MVNGARQPDLLLARMGCLADPTRLRLLRLLERHELGVAEMCHVLKLPQSTVSRHLKVLADLGFLRNRAQRTVHLYQMAKGDLDPAARRLWQLSREETDGWATLHQDQLRLLRHVDQRGRETQRFFAGAAGRWDRMRGELFGESFEAAALAALVPADWVVADLGCGTGPICARLSPQVRRVIGVDQSSAMLKAARRRLEGLANVELRQGDLEALPIADGECDAAVLLLVLGYVPDPRPVIAEMVRILKPGGAAVVVDVTRHDDEEFRRRTGQQVLGFDQETLIGQLGEAGLGEVRFRPLPPAPETKAPALFLASARVPASAEADSLKTKAKEKTR